MSGHSKWHNIQATKNKMDAQRGKIFTKIGREIAVAVKLGGGDPNTNSRLYDVIAKAKQNNMPNDNIQRSIKKAMGETSAQNYDAITYEGYGPHGVAFIVECLTDNRNRTAADVRHLFDKFGGSLGTTGSVTFMFNHQTVIVLAKENLAEDDVMMVALDNGADDIQTEEDSFVVFAAPDKLHALSKAFEEAGMKVASSEVVYVATNTSLMEGAAAESIQKLIDALEDLDDVQEVYTNAEFAE
ncbi:MAG: YebC/PmpR family DNA-binding transcriptional regulator [Clostridia bacterium]|nr:YebC/PmpR family DNA-binding transcriptional regulator [Clostridia bacterium]